MHASSECEGIAGRRRVLLVDDHPIVRGGLAQLIEQEADLTVCGEASDAEQALEAVMTLRPDLAVIDLSLQGSSGLDLIKELQAREPALPLLVLSMHDEALFAERVLRAGARGYIMKQEAREKVIAAIRQVLRGELYFSEHMTTLLLQTLSTGVADTGRTPLSRLTDRELEVFYFISQGYSMRQIAEALNRSVKTAEAHRKNIMEKLSLDNAAQLTRYALQWAQLPETV